MMDKNKVGIAFGLFFAIIHAVWSLAILVIHDPLKTFVDWVLSLHRISFTWALGSFDLVKAIELVVLTFIIGYLFGWVFAMCHNLLHKKK